jgi:hypothetical protein
MTRVKRATVAALVLAALVAGVIAGTAFAGSSGANGVARQASVVPHFSTTTALKVKAAAVVNADGTLSRGSHLPYHVVSTSRLSTGTYEVIFSHSISGCAWFGTVGLGGFSGSTGPADIEVTGRAGTTSGLFIETGTGAGTKTDEPFMVQVVC